MTDRITAPRLQVLKDKGQKIACLTAYDEPTARLADRAGVDVVLVGDSVGSVMYGYSTTIPVELDDIERHTAAALVGCERALLVADLPFGSYQVSVSQAVESSIRLIKCGAGAVKLEGAYSEQIEAIVRAGIPVMGHVGMTPQSVNSFGGHRVQGRGDSGALVLAGALAVQEAGAFAVVLELVPAELAARITAELRIPTIGIGAGVGCDGQIQVFHDLMGISTQSFKHAKRYVEAGALMASGIAQYVEDVKSGEFPTSENSF